MERFGSGKTTGNLIADMGNAPLTAFDEAQNRFFEIYGSAKVESSRWFVAFIVAMAVAAMLGIALYNVMPLKTVVPYMVKVDSQTGAVAQVVTAANFKPDAAVRTYFLSQWVEQVMTLDPYQTQKNVKKAFSVTRDKAVTEFTELLSTDKPIERLVGDPSLTRVVKVNSINPGTSDGIAFVRITTEERSGPGALKTKRYVFTIHYALVPPQTEEDLRINPIGMFITHFVRSDEV